MAVSFTVKPGSHIYNLLVSHRAPVSCEGGVGGWEPTRAAMLGGAACAARRRQAASETSATALSLRGSAEGCKTQCDSRTFTSSLSKVLMSA